MFKKVLSKLKRKGPSLKSTCSSVLDDNANGGEQKVVKRYNGPPKKQRFEDEDFVEASDSPPPEKMISNMPHDRSQNFNPQKQNTFNRGDFKEPIVKHVSFYEPQELSTDAWSSIQNKMMIDQSSQAKNSSSNQISSDIKSGASFDMPNSGLFHGMNPDFMAYRQESSEGGSQFNILKDNFYSGIPLNTDDMPYIHPQSLHSDGSLYNPEDPFNPVQGGDVQMQVMGGQEQWNPFVNHEGSSIVQLTAKTSKKNVTVTNLDSISQGAHIDENMITQMNKEFGVNQDPTFLDAVSDYVRIKGMNDNISYAQKSKKVKTEKNKKNKNDIDDSETSYCFEIQNSEKENAKSSCKEIMEQYEEMGLYDKKAAKKLYEKDPERVESLMLQIQLDEQSIVDNNVTSFMISNFKNNLLEITGEDQCLVCKEKTYNGIKTNLQCFCGNLIHFECTKLPEQYRNIMEIYCKSQSCQKQFSRDQKNWIKNNREFKIFEGTVSDQDDGPDVLGILHSCSICEKVVGIFDQNKDLCKSQCSIVHTKCISDFLPQYTYTILCPNCTRFTGEKLIRLQKQNDYKYQIQFQKGGRAYIVHITKDGYEKYQQALLQNEKQKEVKMQEADKNSDEQMSEC